MNKIVLNTSKNKKALNQDLLYKNASLLLVTTSTICSETIKTNILAREDLEEATVDEFVYTEFLCFYIHLMINTANLLSLTEFQKIKLRTYLEQTIASDASGYLGEGKSEEWKGNYVNVFINTLHQKEEEYKLVSNNKTKEFIPEIYYLSLFSKLAQNIITILNKKEDKENILLLAYEISTKEWARMNPAALLLNIKQNS